jgi:hypothetical protein
MKFAEYVCVLTCSVDAVAWTFSVGILAGLAWLAGAGIAIALDRWGTQ